MIMSSATEATFRNAACSRMKRGETTVVATRAIRAGERILTRPWLERVSFIVSSKREEEQCGLAGVSTSFTDDDHKAIGGGTIIDAVFAQFKTAASLQLTCSVLRRHSTIARQWVTDKVFVRRNAPGIAPMTLDRHRVAIQWLKEHQVSTADLLFWAVRENFAAIYEMVACNSNDFTFVLSGTVAGLAFCPFLALFNHDCWPNVVVEHLPNTYTMTASRDIALGEEICYSYRNEAVGLVSLDELQEYLTARYGFQCVCPLHTKKVSAFPASLEPRSLLFTTRRNKTVAMVIASLEDAVQREQWDVVRRIGRMVWNKYHDLLVAEPRVCFTIGRLYATCIQHTDADEDYGAKWCVMLEGLLERYCANPM